MTDAPRILTLDHDLKWAAGFFEGEGHVKTDKRHNSRALAITIAQVHREPLDKMKEIFQVGKVYGPYGPYSSTRQPHYQYTITGENAKKVLDKMLPFLFHKGEQVREVLDEMERFYCEKHV